MPEAGAAAVVAPQESEAGLEKLLAKLEPLLTSGDTKALVELVREYGRDNADLRARNREVVRERDGLKAKVPADGAVILTGEDATQYAALKALGAPDEIAARLTDADAAKAKLATIAAEQEQDEVATLAGYNPKVLKSLAKLGEFRLAVVEEQDEADRAVRVPVAVVTKQDGTTESHLLSDFVTQHHGDFLPALAVTEAVRTEKVKGAPASPAKEAAKETAPPARALRQHSGQQGTRSGPTVETVTAQKLQHQGAFRI